jgi:hypothetical protein
MPLWTSEEDDILKNGAKDGLVAKQISLRLEKAGFDRSKSAVVSRCRRLGVELNEDYRKERDSVIEWLAKTFPHASIVEIQETIADEDFGAVMRVISKSIGSRPLGDQADFEKPETVARVAAMRARLVSDAA